jgi:hypothetical protein
VGACEFCGDSHRCSPKNHPQLIMDNFVVYAYCRKDGTFYYIGKGRPRRPYGKRKEGIKPPRDRDRILILHSRLSEQTAFDFEEKLILFYGRKDLGTGLLRNMTNGGEGVSGWIPDGEWRKKKSESMSGEGNPMFGMKLAGSSNHMHGKKLSENHVRKISENRRGKCTGEKNHFFDVHLTGELNPMYGKERPDLAARNKEGCPSTGTKWYNNGEVDKRFQPDSVPEGFTPGRLKVAQGHKRPDLSERNRKRGLPKQ